MVTAIRRCVAILAILTVGCSSYPPRPEIWEGLPLYPQKEIHAVYLKPGVNLDQYTAVLLEPASVEFNRGWREAAKRRRPSYDPDVMIAEIRKLYRRIVSSALETAGTFKVVSIPGPNTLRIQPAVSELVIGPSPYREVYAGTMMLSSTMHDSVTGEIVAHFVQVRRGDPYVSPFVEQPTMPRWWNQVVAILYQFAPKFSDGLDSLRMARPERAGAVTP